MCQGCRECSWRAHTGAHTEKVSLKKRAVVELALVGDYVRVRPGRRHQVVVADELSDPRPWHPTQVQKRDAAVAEIVRGERWYAGRSAGSSHCRPEPVGCRGFEYAAGTMPVIAGVPSRTRP